MMAEPEISRNKLIEEQIKIVLSKGRVEESLKRELKLYENEDRIPFRLVKSIHDIISESGEEKVYLHELIEGCDLILPEFKPEQRNPELDARCKKLQAQQDNLRYKEMVKNVDRSQKDYFTGIGKDVKEMDRQLVSVFNFLITVGGAFAFGYKATEYTFGSSPNVFAYQLMAGLTLATVVFFADLYFLLRETSR